jgi:hypothetical protein
VEGVPNKYAIDRTKDNPTTPKATPILRMLLMNPDRMFGVRELAELAGVDKGMVSRMLKAFRKRDWVHINPKQGILVRRPMEILDHWRKRYKFNHLGTEILPGRIESPSIQVISRELERHSYEYAWTMMPAASTYIGVEGYTHYGVYLRTNPVIDLADCLEMEIRSSQPNFWIIVAGRPDTWDNILNLNGFPCVDPFVTYADLKECPDPLQEETSKVLREFIKVALIRRPR